MLKFWWNNGGPVELAQFVGGAVGFAVGMWAIGCWLGVA